jgi:hypothetical protein
VHYVKLGGSIPAKPRQAGNYGKRKKLWQTNNRGKCTKLWKTNDCGKRMKYGKRKIVTNSTEKHLESKI